MNLLDWLFRPAPPDAAQRCDPLIDIIDRARDSQREAIEAVNESRRRRGEPPMAPSWEDLLRPRDEDER